MSFAQSNAFSFNPESLLQELQRLNHSGIDLPLVPVGGNKQPLGEGWQHRPWRASELIEAMLNGGVEVSLQGQMKRRMPQGIGVLTGYPIEINQETYFLLAVDQDGESAASLIAELSGGEGLPPTVSFTSNRPGRCQFLLLVPQQYQESIKTKKLKTGVMGDDGKPEQLEFRWLGCQSVLPPSVHPLTGNYVWMPGCAIDEVAMAIAPNWVIEQMLVEPTPAPQPFQPSQNFAKPQQQWTDIDWALSYVNALSPYRADNYDDWLAVGMALHSVHDSLLEVWDSWSQSSSKYKPGECEKKWKSFSKSGGVSIGTLAHLAKQDGWQLPEPSYTQASEGVKLHSETIEEVRRVANRNIALVISPYVKLQLRDNYYTGRCPFHAGESTTSLSVNPEIGFFECHECSTGGNAIHFLMQLQQRSLTEVVLELANRFEIEAKDEQGQVIETKSPDFRKLNGKGDRKVLNHPAFTPLQHQQILQQINALIDADLPQSTLHLRMAELATQSNCAERSLWRVYRERLKEIEIEEHREDTAKLIDALLVAKDASIDLDSVLPQQLAEPLNKFANWLSVRPESLLLTLLTTVSSLFHSQTTSWLNRDWDFEVKPNLYSAIVAPSSQKKSPILKTIARKPLQELERRARQQWTHQQQEYQELQREYQSLSKEEQQNRFPEGLPQTPPERRKVYSFTKTTAEGLRNQVNTYPDQGLLAIPDELAGLLKSANQYRKGRGSDEEDLLSYYDGMGETVLRADGLAGDFDHLLLAILGTIQPLVLQKFLKDGQDSNGHWARFMFVHQPLVPSVMKADGGSFDLTPMLTDLYERVNQLPIMTFYPELEAFQYYCGVYNELEQRRVNDPSSAMSAVWGKAQGRVGKIATNLHVIHELMAGRKPSNLIPKQRYVEATQITVFSIQQVFTLYNELGDSKGLANHFVKILELSKKKKGWISARDVQLRYDSKSRPMANQVRSWFRELEAMGKGTTQGEGRSVLFHHQLWSPVEKAPTNLPTPKTIDEPSFVPNVEFVGECGVFLQKKVEPSQIPINSQKAPTTPTNSTNAQNVEEIKDFAVETPSTTTPTNSTNAQNVEEIKDFAVETDSTNVESIDEIRDLVVETSSTTAPTNDRESQDSSNENSDISIPNTSPSKKEIIHSVQIRLLEAQRIEDLSGIEEETLPQVRQQAYLSLSFSQRQQLQHLIFNPTASVVKFGQVISPMRFFSELIGMEVPEIEVGNVVRWLACPSNWEPMRLFEVVEIQSNGFVKLANVEYLVPICELRR